MTSCPSCGTSNLDEQQHSYCFKCGFNLNGMTGKLEPQTVLEGRYIIVKTLGRGGMGAVYLALDQRLNNTPVAIKEMSTNAVGQGNLQAAIGSFKTEATMLVNLRHQALPRITDFFSQGEDRWYLVMDYIEGETIKSVAEKHGKIPESEVLDWGKQLCDILDYLHNCKPPVIFRDLKPANIMLTSKGKIKLIDFGIARHFRQGSTADTTAYGSAGFAPPEQYGQNQTDARADLYALGATLHYLLTGIDPIKNPFAFEPLGKTVKISPNLEMAIMKALELKPQNRPANAEEMLNLLTLSEPSVEVKKQDFIRPPKEEKPTNKPTKTPEAQTNIHVEKTQFHDKDIKSSETMGLPYNYNVDSEKTESTEKDKTEVKKNLPSETIGLTYNYNVDSEKTEETEKDKTEAKKNLPSETIGLTYNYNVDSEKTESTEKDKTEVKKNLPIKKAAIPLIAFLIFAISLTYFFKDNKTKSTVVNSQPVSSNTKLVYGKLNGKDTITWPDGSKFIGDVKGGKRHGHGEMTWSKTKVVYDGDFKNDKLEGKGTLTWPKDKNYYQSRKYSGNFKNGEIVGTGTLVYESGNKFIGEVDNKGLIKDGKGTFIYLDKTTYTGDFKNNKFNGNGVITYSNGGKYVGGFINDHYNGKGTYYFANGGKQTANYVNGKAEGKGFYTEPNGNKINFIYKHDKPVGIWK